MYTYFPYRFIASYELYDVKYVHFIKPKEKSSCELRENYFSFKYSN